MIDNDEIRAWADGLAGELAQFLNTVDGKIDDFDWEKDTLTKAVGILDGLGNDVE